MAMEMKRGARRGITLAETVVAILILIVGVYAVAAGFPKLIRAISQDERKSLHTRLDQEWLARRTTNPNGLPFAITQVVNVPAAFTFPEDETVIPQVFCRLSDRPLDTMPSYPNPWDDVVHVIGEAFTVPAPDVGTQIGFCVLQEGMAEPFVSKLSVYEPIKLERLGAPGVQPAIVAPYGVPDDLDGDGAPDCNTFAVHPSGQPGFLNLDQTVAGLFAVYPDYPVLYLDGVYNPDRWMVDSDPTTWLPWVDLLCDYTWIEADALGNVTAVHEVCRESVRAPWIQFSATPTAAYVGTVAALSCGATSVSNVAIVPDSLRVTGRREFAMVAGVPGQGECALAPQLTAPGGAGITYGYNNLGLMLSFNGLDAIKWEYDPREPSGRRAAGPRPMRADYELRTEGDPDDPAGSLRRARVMIEDHLVPTLGRSDPDTGALHYPVGLLVGGVNDAGPPDGVFGMGGGSGGSMGIPLVALDLQTGSSYLIDLLGAASTLSYLRRERVDLADADEEYMDDEGVLDFVAGAAAGHQVRVYYKQIDDTTIHTYKPPDTFVDRQTYTDAGGNIMDPAYQRMAYRMYEFDPTVATLYVANVYEGLAIEVDYDYTDLSGVSRQVRGELHTVQWGRRPLVGDDGGDPSTVQYNTHAALYGPWQSYLNAGAPPANMNTMNVRVLAVRGASVKARTWWLSESGMVKMVDVDTHLQRQRS